MLYADGAIHDHGPGDAEGSFLVVRTHHDFEGDFAGPIPTPAEPQEDEKS